MAVMEQPWAITLKVTYSIGTNQIPNGKVRNYPQTKNDRYSLSFLFRYYAIVPLPLLRLLLVRLEPFEAHLNEPERHPNSFSAVRH